MLKPFEMPTYTDTLPSIIICMTDANGYVMDCILCPRVTKLLIGNLTLVLHTTPYLLVIETIPFASLLVGKGICSSRLLQKKGEN